MISKEWDQHVIHRQWDKDELPVEELKNIVKSLCSTFKCAVCLGVLQKDTLTCVNGHCICTKCQGNEEHCPTCRKDFSNVIQNFLVRQVLDIIPHECQYNSCSYLVKAGDDHESYCCFKPTPCQYCEQEVPAVELANHVKDKHPKSPIVVLKNSIVRTYSVSLEKVWHVKSLFCACGHFFWLRGSNSPTTGVVSFKFNPVLCEKPTHDVYVKISFKVKDSEDIEYEVNKKIKMNSSVNATDENCLIVPVSVIRKLYNKENKQFSFIVGITKTKQ